MLKNAFSGNLFVMYYRLNALGCRPTECRFSGRGGQTTQKANIHLGDPFDFSAGAGGDVLPYEVLSRSELRSPSISTLWSVFIISNRKISN